MALRSVKQVTPSLETQMGSDVIYQPFPSHQLRNVDPFILLHHWGPYEFPPNNNAFSVEAHPHRGFEPVTFIFHGEVWHRDSMGNDSIIKEGGVQWMNSGRGVLHSETGTENFRKTGGKFEIIQVWMNLPKKLKMGEPTYQGVQKNEIPVITQDDGKVKIAVPSGTIGTATGPIKSITGIVSATIHMGAGGKASFESDTTKNTLLYLLHGSVTINGKVVDKERMCITFDDNGAEIQIESSKPSVLLFLSGTALNEPVAQYGPFVMNTVEELQEAFDDFQKGKMGTLED